MATATKTKKEKIEVHTPTILPEVDLDSTINSTLVTNNVTDAVINALAEKYGNLKLSSLDSKEDYLEIKSARLEVRRIGILCEKLCKKGREDAIAIQKKWLNKEAQILDKIAVTQDKLDAEMKRFEDEEKRKEDAIRQEQENNFQVRQSTIIKMGAVYNNGCFELNGVSYESDLLKTADKETWEEVMLPKYNREYQKLEAVRIEAERIKEEASEKLRKEQEAFAETQRLFAEQQRVFQEQQASANRILMEEENRKQEAARNAQNLQNNSRQNELLDLGMRYSSMDRNFSVYGVLVSQADLISFSVEQWSELLAKITPEISSKKQEDADKAEEKRLADIETARLEGIENERIRIENVNIENQRIDEEKRLLKLEQDSQMGDKDKWVKFMGEVRSISVPEMNSKTYKGKTNSAKPMLEQFIAKLINL